VEKRKTLGLEGKSVQVDFPCGRMMITVNRDEDGDVREVFVRSGRQGSCSRTMHENLARLVNLCRNYDIPIEDIVDQLNGHNCGNHTWYKGTMYKSCTDALSAMLVEEGGEATSN